VPAIVLATAIGAGCGSSSNKREWMRIGPPPCMSSDTTRALVEDEQHKSLANVAVHFEAGGGQGRSFTSGPDGAFEIPNQIFDSTEITVPGYEIISRSSTRSCQGGSGLVLVLRPSPPPP